MPRKTSRLTLFGHKRHLHGWEGSFHRRRESLRGGIIDRTGKFSDVVTVVITKEKIPFSIFYFVCFRREVSDQGFSVVISVTPFLDWVGRIFG